MESDKSTVLISAFPCCGKSYCFNHYQKDYSMLDSDSSQFSWVKDEYGKNTNIRNPDFPQNYINHIIDNIGKVDFIFISSHKIVRQALTDNNLRYVLVYPDKDCKEEWIERAKHRGSPETFCNMLNNNWDDFIEQLHSIDDIKVIKQEISSNMYINKEMLDTLHNYSRWFCVKRGNK